LGGLLYLQASIEAAEEHERRRQAEVDARLAMMTKRTSRQVIYYEQKTPSERDAEERAAREHREFLRRQDEEKRREDEARKRSQVEMIAELERQVAEKRRSREVLRQAGRLEREATHREVRACVGTP
jgi:hypothetical protein